MNASGCLFRDALDRLDGAGEVARPGRDERLERALEFDFLGVGGRGKLFTRFNPGTPQRKHGGITPIVEDHVGGEIGVFFGFGFHAQTIELADVSLTHFGTAVAFADLPRTRITYPGSAPDAPWRREALARIEQLRKGDLSVFVLDAAGAPVPDAKIEIDVHGGYKGAINKDLSYDVGLLQYIYPGASTALWDASYKNPDTTELYGALSFGPVIAKLSYALTNLFGNYDFGAGKGSKGSYYFDLTASYDIGGGVMRASLYVDGQLEGTDTGTQNDRSIWDPLRIGAAGDGSRSFDGRIDEVRIYGNELSGAQVQAVARAGVLTNDTDIDSPVLQVNTGLVTGPANGTLSINADGSFAYTPNANFHGADSFTYRANDGAANSNVATVNITVSPKADTPSVTAATRTGSMP